MIKYISVESCYCNSDMLNEAFMMTSLSKLLFQQQNNVCT